MKRLKENKRDIRELEKKRRIEKKGNDDEEWKKEKGMMRGKRKEE